MPNGGVIKAESSWLVNFDLRPFFFKSPNPSDFDNLFFVVTVVGMFLPPSEINAVDDFHAKDPPDWTIHYS
jgi:hypothetical protein